MYECRLVLVYTLLVLVTGTVIVGNVDKYKFVNSFKLSCLVSFYSITWGAVCGAFQIVKKFKLYRSTDRSLSMW